MKSIKRNFMLSILLLFRGLGVFAGDVVLEENSTSLNNLNNVALDSCLKETGRNISIDIKYIGTLRCYGEPSAVHVVVHGGTAPYTIFFDGQERTDVAEDQEVTFYAMPGTYTVTITDYDGCFLETYAEVPQEPELLFTTERACGGVNISISGGTQPYQILIDSQLFISNVLEGEKTFVELPTGAYEISVIDAHECTTNKPFIVELSCEVITSRAIPPSASPAVLASPKNVCGYQECHRFPLRSDLINIITWQAGDQKAVNFAVYDAADLNNELAIVPANGPLIFSNHNRRCGQRTTYNIYAIDTLGHFSVPAVITIG